MDWDQQLKFNEDEEDDTKMKGFDVEILVYNEPKNDKKVLVTLVEENIAEVVLKKWFFIKRILEDMFHMWLRRILKLIGSKLMFFDRKIVSL